VLDYKVLCSGSGRRGLKRTFETDQTTLLLLQTVGNVLLSLSTQHCCFWSTTHAMTQEQSQHSGPCIHVIDLFVQAACHLSDQNLRWPRAVIVLYLHKRW